VIYNTNQGKLNTSSCFHETRTPEYDLMSRSYYYNKQKPVDGTWKLAEKIKN
jgi:hypothetical protein